MPEVELIQPARLNIDGVIYQRGVRVPVEFDVAYQLAANPRFKVHGLDTRAALEHREKQGRPVGDDLMEAIRDAADQLDVDDDDAFDRAGKPSIAALADVLGFPITKEERDRALAGVAKVPQAGPGPIDTGAIKAAAEARKGLVLKGKHKAVTPMPEVAEEPVALT